MTNSAEKDALRIATEACAASPEHSAGRGAHDAHRWGPCSDHERITREVLAALARVTSSGKHDGGESHD